MKIIALGFLATAIATTSALAGEEAINKDYKQPAPPLSTCFQDQEIQLDLFGSFLNLPYGNENRFDPFDGKRDHGRDGGGGGVGVNYFFMRYVGIGVDGDFDSNIGGVANYTGKLILRLPIEAGGICLAPYVFAGGGGESFFDDGSDRFRGFRGFHHHDSTLGAWMVGGGLEWRINRRWGVFAESRYTWTARYSGERGFNYDNDIARVGVRISF